jgi:hypothetical protein
MRKKTSNQKNSAAQANTSFEKVLANPSWAALGGGGGWKFSPKNKHSGPSLGLSLQVGFSARLTAFLENNLLISRFQFGFRKSHSTLQPLILFMNKITENLNNKNYNYLFFAI